MIGYKTKPDGTMILPWMLVTTDRDGFMWRTNTVDLEQRIENFKNMAEADPQNELGHFSLGKAYFDAERFDEAVASLQKVIELNADFSKAYQFLGESQKNLERTDDAVATLMTGCKVAAQRGDMMPLNAMGDLLRQLGQEPPQFETSAPVQADAGAGTVSCGRCGRSGSQLPKPPFKGSLGKTIFTTICNPCWQEWLAMGTKVINELKLDFSNPQAGETYDEHMKEFLQIQE